MNPSLGEIDLLLREPEGPPAGALVLNHGRATNERDLFPLLEALDPDRRLLGVSTGAPLSGLPPGGRHWYIVERVGYPHPETFHRVNEMLAERVDGLLAERDIAPSDAVIGGFSQGAVMSYALALGPGRPTPAALLAFSGFIPEVEGWEPELAGRDGLRALIYHGSADPVIDVEHARRAAARLGEAGIELEFIEAPVGHGIAPEAVEAARGIVSGVGVRS